MGPTVSELPAGLIFSSGGNVPLALPQVLVSAEMDLLLACLRWPISGSTRQLVSRKAAIVLDWELFCALVSRHRVSPLVAHALRESDVVLPMEIHNVLGAAASRASLGELRLAGELKALLAGLNAAGIRPIVLKGLGLAIRAYGRLGMRYNRDIDLLIGADQVRTACDVLERAGFQRIAPAGDVGEAGLRRWLGRQKDMVYACSARAQVVELHWRLFDNANLLPFKDDGVRGRVELARDFTIETLPTELDLIFICLHGANHSWSRLKWIADLHAIFAQMTPAELVLLHEAARARAAHRATAQAMLLCARLFGLAVPVAVLCEARRDWRIRALDRLARYSMLAGGKTEIEELALGSTIKNISHYLLANSLKYVLSEVYFDLTDISAEEPTNLPRYLLIFARIYGWGQRHFKAFRRQVRRSKSRP